MSLLKGECNRCGLCCWVQGEFKCENLVVMKPGPQPGATFCKVYETRTNGMPIKLIRKKDGATIHGTCLRDTIHEDILILPYIGKGCSLEVEKNG